MSNVFDSKYWDEYDKDGHHKDTLRMCRYIHAALYDKYIKDKPDAVVTLKQVCKEVQEAGYILMRKSTL